MVGVSYDAAAAEGKRGMSLASSGRRNPWSPLFKLGAANNEDHASFHLVGGNFGHLGDSATETAGVLCMFWERLAAMGRCSECSPAYM